MTRIFYGVCGEGLGHCSRVQSIIEKLDAQIHIFTFGEAFKFFQARNYPYLHSIPGLQFGRNKNHHVSYLRSLGNACRFKQQYGAAMERILSEGRKLRPKLIISDYEPILPRVSKTLEIPCLSIDQQHKFSRCTTNNIPLSMKPYVWTVSAFTERFVPTPNEALVGTFYNRVESVIPAYGGRTILTDCFLRKEIFSQQVRNDDFILVYHKPFMRQKVLKALKGKAKVKVYGCASENQIEGFEYHPLKYEQFVRDLARCSHLIGGSGNQLLGEALYLGKPLLTIPEPNQYEQYINAHYWDIVGNGKSCFLKKVDSVTIDSFIHHYKSKPVGFNNALETATELIESYL